MPKTKLLKRVAELRKRLKLHQTKQLPFLEATVYGRWHKRGSGRRVVRRITVTAQVVDCRKALAMAEAKLRSKT